jgi:hypothetical protein
MVYEWVMAAAKPPALNDQQAEREYFGQTRASANSVSSITSALSPCV